mgnify:CR=1 FL=1
MKHELKCLGKMKLKSLLNSIQLKNDYKALVSKLNSDHRMNIFNVGEFINKHGKNLNAETASESSSTKSRPNNKPSKEDLWRFVNNFTDVQDFNVLRKIFDVKISGIILSFSFFSIFSYFPRYVYRILILI